MESKIKQYVKYQLYYYEADNKDELCEEISGDLIDHYRDLLKDIGNEQTAYLKTISKMGEFIDADIPDDDYRMPLKFENLSMLLGAIFAGAGFFTLLIYFPMGLILTIASVTFFVVGAHVSYTEAQQARKKDGNMALYVSRLKKIFTYAKSSFFFWAAITTVLLSIFIANLYSQYRHGLWLSSFNDVTNDPFELIELYGSLGNIMRAVTIVFIVTLIVVGIISYFVYWKFAEHYEMLTGEKKLKGGFGNFFAIIKQGHLRFRDVVLKATSLRNIALVGLLFSLLAFTYPATMRLYYSETEGNLFNLALQSATAGNTGLVGLEFLVLTLAGLLSAVFILYKRYRQRVLGFIPPLLSTAGIYLLGFRQAQTSMVDFDVSDNIMFYYYLGVALFTVFIVGSYIILFIDYRKRE